MGAHNPMKPPPIRWSLDPMEPAPRKGHWMRTFTNRRYWPADPRPEDVCIEDIAHHLSLLCRYTGAVPRFYSVGEHSWHMSFLVSRSNQLCALLHDSTEAYMNDLGRPVKYAPEMAAYKEMEDMNWRLAIAPAFDLPLELPDEVKRMDGLIIKAELAEFGMDLSDHMLDKTVRDGPVPDVQIAGYPPETAEALFLQRFHDLRSMR